MAKHLFGVLAVRKGLATESDIGTVFREAEIAVTCQDAGLVYTAALNPFVALPAGGSIIGQTDEAVFNGLARSLLTTKRRVAETGKGESIDLAYGASGRERVPRLPGPAPPTPTDTTPGNAPMAVTIARARSGQMP